MKSSYVRTVTASAPRATAAIFAFVLAAAGAQYARSATIVLPAAAVPASKSAMAAATDGAAQIGFAREVPGAQSRIDASAMQWIAGPGGTRIGRFSVKSTGAAALRVALAI